METPYSAAWKEFTKGREYQRLMDQWRAVMAPTVPEKYLSNRIACAFDAGWNARDNVAADTAEAEDARWRAQAGCAPTEEERS